MPEVPKLTSLPVSSARSAFEDQIPSDLPTTITYNHQIIIRAPPGTNFWRQPPNTDIQNAPTRLIPIPIDKFHSARVTVSANWSTPYDQGGLILFIIDGNTTSWVKTGFELKEKLTGMAVFSVPWSDVGTVPLENVKDKMTIQVERQVEKGKKLDSLRVYIVDETGKKGFRRNTSWFTHNVPGPDQKISKDTSTSDNRQLLVGIFAARPTIPEGEGREHGHVVTFEGFEVKLFDD